MISRCVTLCRMPGGTLMAGLVFVACSWFLGALMPTTIASALWIVSLCALSFIAGAMLYTDLSIEQAIMRDGPAALVLATLFFVIDQILVAVQALPLAQPGSYAISAVLAGSFPWFGAIACLGLGKRFFSFTNATLEYLKEAVFPYFLLHMLILSFFGYIFLEHSSLPGSPAKRGHRLLHGGNPGATV